MLADLMEPQNKLNKKSKIILVDIEDIHTNTLNDMPMEDVAELAESIFNKGLYSPLEVYEEDGEYVLIGGERRYTALNKLYSEGRLEDTDIQCLLRDKPADEFSELLQMCLSNAQRDSEDARIGQTRMLIAALEKATPSEIQMMKDEAAKTYPLIDREKISRREMIAAQIGRSPRTIDKYIKKINGTEQKSSSREKETEDSEVFNRLSDKIQEDCPNIENLLGIKCKFNKSKKELILSFSSDDPEEILQEYNSLLKKFNYLQKLDTDM